METTSLLLVLCSAVLHAIWNFLAKTIPGGAAFVWLLAVVMSVLLLPFSFVYIALYGFEWSALNVGALLLTGVLHLVYFLVLQKGYAVADLSVVYPLARGSGPVFATLGAVLFLHERLSPFSIAGLGLVVAGVLLISGIGRASSDPKKRRDGLVYGITTGVLIASYTVWDGFSVKTLAIPPLLLEASSHPIRVIALAGVARKRRAEIGRIWREHRWKVLAVALISPLGFLLVLYAMRTAPVHIVAPVRELSIVIGVFLGARLLTEEHFRIRLLGAGLILAGIVLLSG